MCYIVSEIVRIKSKCVHQIQISLGVVLDYDCPECVLKSFSTCVERRKAKDKPSYILYPVALHLRATAELSNLQV